MIASLSTVVEKKRWFKVSCGCEARSWAVPVSRHQRSPHGDVVVSYKGVVSNDRDPRCFASGGEDSVFHVYMSHGPSEKVPDNRASEIFVRDSNQWENGRRINVRRTLENRAESNRASLKVNLGRVLRTVFIDSFQNDDGSASWRSSMVQSFSSRPLSK
jgi:hypothetical protein